MKPLNLLKSAAPALLAFAVTVSHSASAEDIRYLNASRVPVRASDSASSAAQGYFVTNQRVRLLANKGEWCEIEGGSPGVHGYCLCKYLDNAPLSLATVQQQAINQKLTPRMRLDWASKAFWLEPSLTNWVRVAALTQDVLLTDEMHEKEYAQKKSLRFKVPEFEAMKEKLAQGVLPPAPKGLQQTDDSQSFAPLNAAEKRLQLPKIKLSYFGNDEVMVLPSALFWSSDPNDSGVLLAEVLASYYKQPYRSKVTQPAAYAGDSVNQVVGAWDVDRIDVNFGRPLPLQTINAQGKPGSVALDGIETTISYSGACGPAPYRLNLHDDKQDRSDMLLAWVGKPALEQKARVKQRTAQGKKEGDKLTVSDIDLDGDGVADFSIWNGVFWMEATRSNGNWQAIYANIGGKWRLMLYTQDQDCV